MKTAYKTLLIFSIIFVFIACAPLTPPIQRMNFPESEYLALKSTGSATIHGQAFMRTRGGEVRTAAGLNILLNPVTSYSNEWYQLAYLEHKKIDTPDPRLWKYTRTQIADSGGNFVFKNVPAGEYYVTTGIFWDVPYYGKQGGIMSQRVSVKDGENLEVMLVK